MGDILGFIHPVAKILFIYGPVKLKSKLSLSKMQGQAENNHSHVQKEKWGGIKCSLVPSKYKNQVGKFHRVFRPGNSPLWLDF